MKQYRKKPVVIEAIQTPARGEEPSQALIDLVNQYGWAGDDDGIIIPTPEGDLIALPEDWIIRGVKGEYYPCKPDIFAATYEEA